MFEKFGKTLDRLVKDVGGETGMHRIEPITETVNAPYPEADCPQLRLEIGVGTLKLQPGTDQLLDGSVTYNIEEWKPRVQAENQFVTVNQGVGLHMLGAWFDVRNEWKLALGTRKPFELSVSKGAGESRLELGGVPLASARIEIGAGKSSVAFDKLNPTPCSAVKVDLGAGSLLVDQLLNANTDRFSFSGGAGELTLNFTGEALQHPMTAALSTGAGKIVLNLKHGLACQITVKRFMGTVHTYGDFRAVQTNVYEMGDYQTASGPKLQVQIECLVADVLLNEV